MLTWFNHDHRNRRAWQGHGIGRADNPSSVTNTITLHSQKIPITIFLYKCPSYLHTLLNICPLPFPFSSYFLFLVFCNPRTFHNGQHRLQFPAKPSSKNPKGFSWSPNLRENCHNGCYIGCITNKQTSQIVGIEFDARYYYSPTFKFFAYANAVVSVFCLLSLFLVFLIHFHGSNPTNYFILFLHDLVMLCLLMAGCSAATAIGYVGQHGNSHSGWAPICDHLGKFCKRGTNSVVLSYLSD